MEAQEPEAGGSAVVVDERGVMRWTATGDEVALFGVNYSTPFAHAYRAHGYVGADRKQAIDADVLHLARLGLDAYRIHVWDRQVSDRQGNLMKNDHLDLLDYVVTTRYMDAMASALRAAGFDKPIFYNISQGYSDEHGRAVCAAQIDGVSHQWYPRGLVRNGAVGGNMLPNVDRYTIPYDDFAECRDKARMVYEFDAVDVAGSYMYPAIARSFRTAGFQWATQFAYDPLAIAYANTEYQTHSLNLVYTPGKAISFMIAGAAFRMIPRGASNGTYPESERFGVANPSSARRPAPTPFRKDGVAFFLRESGRQFLELLP